MEWVTPQLLFSMCFASFLLGAIAVLLIGNLWDRKIRGK